MLCTVNDIKQRLGLAAEDTRHDETIERIVLGFTARAERFCGRGLIVPAAEVTETYTGGTQMIQLERYPVVSIASVKESYGAAFDTLEPLTAGQQWRLLRTGRTGVLLRQFTVWPGRIDAVQVVYRGGYCAAGATPEGDEIALPADLREAAICQCRCMAKDVNIPVRAEGAERAKQQLDGVSRSAGKIGDTAQQTGRSAETGFGKVRSALGKLAGPLGFTALLAVIARVSRAVSNFFDEMARRIDEAVRRLKDLRSGYEGLFEAMNAFDERSRRQVVGQSLAMLAETRVPQEVGLPVIEAYARQFRGQMGPEAYDAGLRGMLEYAAQHGGAATPDLIGMMAGFGMTDPARQGAFRRQIAEAAGRTGLTDGDVIGALSRGMPTIQAMGWSPDEAVATVAALAAGEAGRQRQALPARTLEALMGANISEAEGLGIDAETAADPQRLFAAMGAHVAGMEPHAATRALQQVYGRTGATGVYKLMQADMDAQRAALDRAAGPEGIAREQRKAEGRRGTFEAEHDEIDALVALLGLDVTGDEARRKLIRRLGRQYREERRRRDPVGQWARDLTGRFDLTTTVDEEAAFSMWADSLSEEERAEIADPLGSVRGHFFRGMTEDQRFSAVRDAGRERGITVINNHYDYSTNLQRSEGNASPRISP